MSSNIVSLCILSKYLGTWLPEDCKVKNTLLGALSVKLMYISWKIRKSYKVVKDYVGTASGRIGIKCGAQIYQNLSTYCAGLESNNALALR